ncbi:hypothetical protein M4D56_13885 [Cytobacillus oceanisediminis]|uniref:hypothetical protein n=1 Tax=Cytobacillus TaxID=2675230 RepID=UPI00203D8712|nr:hypothetical protein [Cytobacillus oceanisediminis]MBY0155638.1 hypothetical protein [Cytobacillus firmus]MCM3246722.1 hypothetical protein [Cytobacillus oceanisediminis]MCM3530167.1 hypothetical protein [Cytobacillus oceanisediminis]MCS0823847.1 hypothetical protein [Cytobacillus firmus]
MQREKTTSHWFLAVLLVISLFAVPFNASAEEEIDVPEVEFSPEIINQYIDGEGNLITETSSLPDSFVTDQNGNIIKSGGVSTFSCAYQYKYETLSDKLDRSNTFINYHPSFKSWDKVDGYFFGQSTVSYSIGYSGASGASVSVSVAPPGNGTFIKADPARWSRPGIYGDVWRKYQRITRTGGCSSEKYITYKTSYHTKKTYIKAKYQ